jgi:hypothetical protein
MSKPKPILWIPANAEARNPITWFNPHSLCRTCIYQFLQEPFCETTIKEGYERETQIDPEISTLSYTEIANDV